MVEIIENSVNIEVPESKFTDISLSLIERLLHLKMLYLVDTNDGYIYTKKVSHLDTSKVPCEEQFHERILELEKQIEDLNDQLKEIENNPKITAINISNFFNNPKKRKELNDELEKTKFEESDIKICERIMNEINSTELEKIDWDDIKNEYNESNNKKKFIEDFQEKWFSDRAATLTKKDSSLTKDEVKLKRFKFLLLGNYIITCDPRNKTYLNYRLINYQRLATLHDLLGTKVLELPMATTFFTKHSNGTKFESFIEWVKQYKE
ncbi:37309_t:CDS:2, partial [Gigaspora margarita]